MNNSMISAMVSMSGIQQRLDLIADNMANMDTTGYKRKESSFEDTLTRVKEQSSEFKLDGRATPSGFNLGFGSQATTATLNFAQGSIVDTGNLTDLAIEGNGLFAIEAAGGVKGYTRAGDFHIQPNPVDSELSYLVTNQGHYVLNADGDRIEVPSGSTLQIDRDGNIVATKGNEQTEIGALQLKSPLRPNALVQKDDNMFVLATGAVEDDILTDTWQLPENQQAHIRQGALEKSNVDLTKEMADMMQVQRAYQLAARALTSSETMMGLANNLRG
ncbi:flagellar basal-body rod protein FlgG [Paenibacillus anaericanus]|uniref:flagellar hook-basal body protein n=1 Tax=Paenibacillus anaericanus TaxID=170367 RepID=UPI00277DF9BA|nr:flagellar hook-basal body protein [Paenibacillus anaericanus]MDQ0089856.1 flagellar basal-body rod protein FlgG [Paenibacillus anaericanus]